jgi:hypothetical protein
LTSHRPPVFVAATAATVLGALYFVPSASATQARTTPATLKATPATTVISQQTTRLADAGSANTAPYMIGGTALLGIGVALMVDASRRRSDFAQSQASGPVTDSAASISFPERTNS